MATLQDPDNSTATDKTDDLERTKNFIAEIEAGIQSQRNAAEDLIEASNVTQLANTQNDRFFDQLLANSTDNWIAKNIHIKVNSTNEKATRQHGFRRDVRRSSTAQSERIQREAAKLLDTVPEYEQQTSAPSNTDVTSLVSKQAAAHLDPQHFRPNKTGTVSKYFLHAPRTQAGHSQGIQKTQTKKPEIIDLVGDGSGDKTPSMKSYNNKRRKVVKGLGQRGNGNLPNRIPADNASSRNRPTRSNNYTLSQRPPPLYPNQQHHSTRGPLINRALGSPESPGLYRDLSRRLDIVKPLDNAQAKIRVEYPPNTIARDLQRTLGIAGPFPPLNYHLLGLMKIFPAVNDRSDLATFRWDLVEGSIGMPPAYSQQGSQNGTPIQNMPMRPPQPIRDQFAIASGPFQGTQRPNGQGVGGEINPGFFQPVQLPYQSQPQSFARPQGGHQNQAQSLYRPSGGPHSHPTSYQPSQNSVPNPLKRSQPSNSPHHGHPSNPASRPQHQPVTVPSNGTPRLNLSSRSVPSRNSIPSGHSRLVIDLTSPVRQPPGSISRPAPPVQSFSRPTTISTADGGQRRRTLSSSSSLTPSTIKKKIDIPPGSKNFPKPSPSGDLAVVITPGSPVRVDKRSRPSYAPNTAVSSLKLPKKKGRPFSSPEAAAAAQKRAEEQALGLPKKRGRAFGFKITKQKDVPVPEPTYFDFDCEWHGCQAVLHNFETLLKHVKVVHRKRNASGNLECRWGKCCVEEEVVTLRGGGEPSTRLIYPEFEAKEEWKAHMWDEHLFKMNWQMGDGPKGTDLSIHSKSEQDALPFWLKDPLTGRLITPSIKNQPSEPGLPKVRNRKRFKIRVHGPDDYSYEPIKNPKSYSKAGYEDAGDDDDIAAKSGPFDVEKDIEEADEVDESDEPAGRVLMTGLASGGIMRAEVPTSEGEEGDEMDVDSEV